MRTAPLASSPSPSFCCFSVCLHFFPIRLQLAPLARRESAESAHPVMCEMDVEAAIRLRPRSHSINASRAFVCRVRCARGGPRRPKAAQGGPSCERAPHVSCALRGPTSKGLASSAFCLVVYFALMASSHHPYGADKG